MRILELIGADRRAATLKYRYRVAGLPWSASQPISLLEPFRAAPHDGVAAVVPESCFADGAFDCATTGWLAGAQRTVQVRYRDGWCVLTVTGVGQFQIKPDQIKGPETGPGLSSSTLNETLLGPPLLLALAGNRRFALHASAVAMGSHGLWLFLGDSGAGKSTLAAYIGSQPPCRRVADDVLPVCWDGERLWALPWYPQLKLGREAQGGGGALPERLEVMGICQLNFVPAANSVAVERLSCPDALITLIRQTVSARLFSPALLAAHLDACARTVETLPVYRLDVPRQLVRLGEVYRTLQMTFPKRVGENRW